MRRGAAHQGHVATAAVINSQVAAQPAVALSCALKANPKGLFARQGLDESLCLAVGSRRVKPCAFGSQPHASQAIRHGLEQYALPLSESTLRHVIPWLPN